MAKKSSKSRGQKRTPSKKRAGAGLRATSSSRGGRRRTAGAKTPAGKARRKKASNPPRPGKQKRAGASRAKSTTSARETKSARTGARRATKAKGARKTATGRGGTGREQTLAQTPQTGRTRKGRTNPMPTRRSTGTPAGAGTSRSPRLDRARRTLREIEEGVPTPPSSLDLDRDASAVRSGRHHQHQAREDHNETSPVMTGGDVDADWQDAYSVGDEAPGGDNPTPDQDRVEDIGKALGIEYQDNEELKASDKVAERDRHRWELDPASSEDYTDRD